MQVASPRPVSLPPKRIVQSLAARHPPGATAESSSLVGGQLRRDNEFHTVSRVHRRRSLKPNVWRGPSSLAGPGVYRSPWTKMQTNEEEYPAQLAITVDADRLPPVVVKRRGLGEHDIFKYLR